MIPTQTEIFTALRAALIDILQIEVVQTVDNDLPRPQGNYVAMTPLMMTRFGTNASEYTETTRTESNSTDTQIQLDFYGDNAASNCQAISLLFRSDVFFKYGIVPLYASDPRQLAFIGGERLMIPRWNMDIHLNVNYSQILQQQTANQLHTHTILGLPA